MSKLTVDFKNIKPLAGLDEYRKSMGKLLELDDDQEKKIKKRLKKEIAQWLADTAEQHRILQDWADLADGIVDDSADLPYDGAPSTHIDMVGIFMKAFHSVCRRSILGSESIWFGEVDPEHPELDEEMASVESMMNWKARHEWNIEEMISEAIWCAARDRLAALKIIHVDKSETVKDTILVESVEQLAEEFSDFEESGLDQKEFAMLAQRVMTEASPENPLEIPIEYEKVEYFGPKAYLVERINLVVFPAQAKSFDPEYCRGYGERYTIRKGEIKANRDKKIWYADAVKSLLQKGRKGSEGSSYQLSREQNVGISRTGDSDQYEFYCLVYRMELDKGKGEVKFEFDYSEEHDELMAARVYFYRCDYMALYRIERRPNQLDGKCIPEQLEELSYEVDHVHSNRLQSREIAGIPSFKGKKGNLGKDFDPNAEENRWRPGVIFWLDDPATFEQFKVQPTDLGESMQEEANDWKIASVIVGLDPFQFAGLPSQDDPNAPGNKTALLINQGNLRMEDPLSELRYGVEETGNICLSHLYQFGPTLISFNREQGGKMVPGTIRKRIIRSGIRMRMSGVTVMMNPDSEFRKWMGIYGAVAAEPVMQQLHEQRLEMIRSAFRYGRIPGRDRILPSMEQIQQISVAIQKQAMMEMQAEQQENDVERASKDAVAKTAAGKAEIDLQDTVKKTEHNEFLRKVDQAKAVVKLKAEIAKGAAKPNAKAKE